MLCVGVCLPGALGLRRRVVHGQPLQAHSTLVGSKTPQATGISLAGSSACHVCDALPHVCISSAHCCGCSCVCPRSLSHDCAIAWTAM
mmetsp:Transcript_28029/g.69255  ORF Transcript_28029/g.69255 Transcript_28029/m.69255 type:complete len:88 (-) Transcript_28029:150-413(-)